MTMVCDIIDVVPSSSLWPIAGEIAPEVTSNQVAHTTPNNIISSSTCEHTKSRELNPHQYTLVLIDGDAMPFHDDLVYKEYDCDNHAARLRRGEDAAILLLDAADNQYPTEPNDIRIMVFASRRGLSKTYAAHFDCTEPILDDFISGFNKVDPSCDYVDAGNGKQGADEKIYANCKRHMRDPNCTRILPGVSSDNGYGRFLDCEVPRNILADKVCLIEGPRFPAEFACTVSSLRIETTQWTHIFRSTKLPCCGREPLDQSPPLAEWSSPSMFHSSSPPTKTLSLSSESSHDISIIESASYSEQQLLDARGANIDTHFPVLRSDCDLSGASKCMAGTDPGTSQPKVVERRVDRSSGALQAKAGAASTWAVMASQPKVPAAAAAAYKRRPFETAVFDPQGYAELIRATIKQLKAEPDCCNFNTIRETAAKRLGVPPARFRVDRNSREYQESSRVIRWSTERWLEQTDGRRPAHPHGEAMWLRGWCDDRSGMAAVLRAPGNAMRTTRGEASWAGIFERGKANLSATRH